MERRKRWKLRQTLIRVRLAPALIHWHRGRRGLTADLQRVSCGRRVLSSPTFHWPGQFPSQRRDLACCGQLILKHERRALPASPNRRPSLYRKSSLFSPSLMLVTCHRIKSFTAVKNDLLFYFFPSPRPNILLEKDVRFFQQDLCRHRAPCFPDVCVYMSVSLCFQVDCLIICSIIFLEAVLHCIKHIYR